MKYFVLNRGDELSAKLTADFHQLAQQYHMEEDAQTPDVVLSIGGDGTLLHAVHMFVDRLETTQFVGVHTGHLGFFADWKSDEIPELVRHMAGVTADSEQRRVIQYPIVEAAITTAQETKIFYALNEFTLKGVASTLVAQLNINDEMFETFRGDGICISSPSGSTAYNKSLGGAVIHPALESIQITEIASINNRVYRTLGSSVILPRHHHCDIIPISEPNIQLSVDHQQFMITDIQSIRCMVAEKKVTFVRYRPFPFWTRVKEAFIGTKLD